MLRTGLWILNAALLLGCAYYLATGVREAFFPAPGPEVTLPEERPAAPAARSFDGYRALARRELIGSGPTPVAAPEPVEEDLAKSRLQLRLIGTAAATDPALSVAAVLDQRSREKLVVRPGDELSGAEVVRIERGRLVLRNQGRLEELTWDDENAKRTTAPARRADRRAARGRAPLQRPATDMEEQIQRLAEQARAARPGGHRENVLTQARVIPRYQAGGTMGGLELRAIRSGSLLEQAGFQNGDVVVAIDGSQLADPREGLRRFRELGAAERFMVDVERDGSVVQFEYTPEPIAE